MSRREIIYNIDVSHIIIKGFFRGVKRARVFTNPQANLFQIINTDGLKVEYGNSSCPPTQRRNFHFFHILRAGKSQGGGCRIKNV